MKATDSKCCTQAVLYILALVTRMYSLSALIVTPSIATMMMLTISTADAPPLMPSHSQALIVMSTAISSAFVSVFCPITCDYSRRPGPAFVVT